jgi:hypothetical protein
VLRPRQRPAAWVGQEQHALDRRVDDARRRQQAGPPFRKKGPVGQDAGAAAFQQQRPQHGHGRHLIGSVEPVARRPRGLQQAAAQRLVGQARQGQRHCRKVGQPRHPARARRAAHRRAALDQVHGLARQGLAAHGAARESR